MIVGNLASRAADPRDGPSGTSANHYTMIVGTLRNSLRSLARRPGKPLVFLIILIVTETPAGFRRPGQPPFGPVA